MGFLVRVFWERTVSTPLADRSQRFSSAFKDSHGFTMDQAGEGSRKVSSGRPGERSWPNYIPSWKTAGDVVNENRLAKS
jgi:hypothetical protein